MSYPIPGNQKHLSLQDRCYIEDSLNQGMSFKNIAKYLCKDPTTISKEQCNRLDRAPFVCNGCTKKKSSCTVPHKYAYNAHFAHRKYEELRSTSRKGGNLTKHEALEMDSVVRPLILQVQSPYQIINNHPEPGISVKTLYNYIDSGILLTRNIDLKRKAEFKPRKNTKTGITNRDVFIGRTYNDFRQLNP